MMRPVIIATTPSNNASILDAEEQTWLDQDKQQRSKGLTWNAFLLGSVHGSVLQGGVFATYYSILKIWDQHLTFTSFLSLTLDIGVPISIWLTFFYFITSRSESLYLRRVRRGFGYIPAGSNSIWTARMSLLVTVYFWFGYIMGTCLFLVGVCVPMGMNVPLMRLLMTVVVNFILCWLLIKCFDWRHNKSGEEQENEEDQPLSCTQTGDDSLKNSIHSSHLAI